MRFFLCLTLISPLLKLSSAQSTFTPKTPTLYKYKVDSAKIVVPADEDVILIEDLFTNIQNVSLTPITYSNGSAVPYTYPEEFFKCLNGGNTINPVSRDVTSIILNSTNSSALFVEPFNKDSVLVLKADNSITLLTMTYGYYKLTTGTTRKWNSSMNINTNSTFFICPNVSRAVFLNSNVSYTIAQDLSSNAIVTSGLIIKDGIIKSLVYANMFVLVYSTSFDTFRIETSGLITYLDTYNLTAIIAANASISDADYCDKIPNPVSFYFLDSNSGIQQFDMDTTTLKFTYKSLIYSVQSGSKISFYGDLVYLVVNAVGQTFLQELFYENRQGFFLNRVITFFPIKGIFHGERYVFFHGTSDTHGYLYRGIHKDFASLNQVFGKYVNNNLKIIQRFGYINFGRYPSNFFAAYSGEYIFLYEFQDVEPMILCSSNMNGRGGDSMDFQIAFYSATCPSKPSNTSVLYDTCVVTQNFQLIEKSLTAVLDQGLNGLGIGLGIGIPLFLILGGTIFYFWYRRHKERMEDIQKQFDDLRYKKFNKNNSKAGFSALEKDNPVLPDSIKMEIE